MNRRRRFGFTLIEMLVVMTAGMTVLMLAIGMIQKSMHLAAVNRTKMDQSTVTDRFLREFRRDAHQAVSFELDQELMFLLPTGSQVRYTIDANTVTRILIVESKTAAKEVFDIGDDRQATFASAEPERISLRIETIKPATRLDRHVTAVVGRWLPQASDLEVAE